MNVACLLGHIGRDDYLGVLVDDCLGVVGVVETVNGFHHPGFGIGEVALRPPLRCGVGCCCGCRLSDHSLVAAFLCGPVECFV